MTIPDLTALEHAEQQATARTTAEWDAIIAQQQAARRYSVICSSRCNGKACERVVATGLPLDIGRAMSARLDREYRHAVESSGKSYSAWTADLHYCQLESES